MPQYDWTCPDCGGEHDELLSYEEYDAWESAVCKCGRVLTKEDRVLGIGLKTAVVGVGKGGYNSNDWS